MFLFSTRNFSTIPGKSPYSGGSPEYWSPEQSELYETMKKQGINSQSYQFQLQNLSNINEKIDIYGFGLIILEMLEGKKGWIRGDKIEYILRNWIDISFDKHLINTVFGFKRFLHQAIRGLRNILLKCLAYK